MDRWKNQTVIDCLQLSDTKTHNDKKWRHSEELVHCIKFYGWILKLDRVKMMDARWKINAIWWNIKINLEKLADACGTNLQNFTQEDLTEVPILQKVLGDYFLKHRVHRL